MSEALRRDPVEGPSKNGIMQKPHYQGVSEV